MVGFLEILVIFTFGLQLVPEAAYPVIQNQSRTNGPINAHLTIAQVKQQQ